MAHVIKNLRNNDLVVKCLCGKEYPVQKNLVEFLQQSNAIEGVYDTDSLIQALEAWDYLIEQKELTAGVVLKTHKILMLHQPLRPDEKGYFRKRPVWVARREGLNYKDVPEAIDEWCRLANMHLALEGKQREDTIVKDHVAYEKIHPFIDGNGRTGRLFLNWQRVKSGLEILVIHEDRKERYYRWFE